MTAEVEKDSEPLPGAGTEPARNGGIARLRRFVPGASAIAIYSVLAAFVYGIHPPATSASLPPCSCGDISSQVWFLAWPAYALAHGHNPFYTGFADWPQGVNLMDNPAMPLLGIVFAPLTWILGPLSTLSFLMRLSFAVSGTAMYFLLRRWTSWWPAALLGGLLYEFCPFIIGQAQSHLVFIFLPLPPIMAGLLDALINGRRVVRNGLLLGVTVIAQLLISEEILAISLLAGAGALVVLAIRHPVAARERFAGVAKGFAFALIPLVVLGAYPLWVYFKGPYHVSGPPHPISELDAYFSKPLSLVYPTSLQRIGFGSWRAKGMARLQNNGVEHNTYLGVTMIALLVFIAIRCRRVGLVQLFSLVALGAWSVTLGLKYHGVRMPYYFIVKVPLINGALDLRYASVMYLAVAVVFAVGLDRMREEGIFSGLLFSPRTEPTAPPMTFPRAGATRAGPLKRLSRPAICLCIAAVALLPLVPALPYRSTPPGVPALFTAADSPLKSGSVVLSYPLPIGDVGFNDQALLWQSAANMRFKLIAFRGAVAGPNHKVLRGSALLLPPYQAEDILLWGLYGEPTPPENDPATARAIEVFLRSYSVTAVTVVPSGTRTADVISYYTNALRVPPVSFQGAYIWPNVQQDLARIRFGSP
ncbi:MAG: hypothetical protein WAL04_05620 [Acidimicrobiales bacterium]